ncbi:hypothetical protein SAMN04488134_103166 [Amphibacillus marinus]|uniref:YolD-like protein n=1 Tax=Amphibacillus marinus TaxID=872970 RepID=A0A1H8LDB3_9BACI|nr:hypothetical protein [Amphibacillus marinus]SEO03063.1 hypothetical protein SAMN04488134_103166 [Amphibacillus marinus]
MKYVNDDYHDRGKKKWHGFYLSEHSWEREQQLRSESRENNQKEQMTLEQIGQILNNATIKHNKVTIQLEAVNEEGNYYDDISGFINGADERGIYIDQHRIDYDEIRHAEMIGFRKWTE